MALQFREMMEFWIFSFCKPLLHWQCGMWRHFVGIETLTSISLNSGHKKLVSIVRYHSLVNVR